MLFAASSCMCNVFVYPGTCTWNAHRAALLCSYIFIYVNDTLFLTPPSPVLLINRKSNSILIIQIKYLMAWFQHEKKMVRIESSALCSEGIHLIKPLNFDDIDSNIFFHISRILFDFFFLFFQ